jgi:hypothetical protein
VSDVERRPAVFTPGNEPYLGLQSVLWFDRIIVWALEGNQRVATYTHARTDQLSPLQKAACQIIPQGINIALSIRELVRQGYLFPAMVLMRPLIERAAVLSYLADYPEAVSLWEGGWKHSQRPPLAKMLQSMGGANVNATEAGKICAAHNHIVHADPVGTYYNLVHLGDGRAAYASSKMLDSPEMADTISMEAQCYLIVLAGRMAQVFPYAATPPLSADLSGSKGIQ